MMNRPKTKSLEPRIVRDCTEHSRFFVRSGRFGSRFLACTAPILILVLVNRVSAEPTGAKSERLFAQRVLPVLREKCFTCHGDDQDDVRGELDMRTLPLLLQGGESGGPSLVPGNPEESAIYLAVTRTSDLWPAMPPKDNDKLTGQQTVEIKQWIADGAPWPDARRLKELAAQPTDWNDDQGVSVSTSGGLSADWSGRGYKPENLWAYQPLRRDIGKQLMNGRRHPIDALIQRRLDGLDLEPAPAADRLTLIRRVTFDLIGLPPTPREIEAFVRDPDSDEKALAKVVERLLDSPHYGEQWGRHWLDVVRYADSSGYANDYERGNAWRYRDYVIRSFNQDKPYDQFIRDQIAGDEIDADNPEMLVATGFLRMGPWELTGMEVAKVARQRFLDDVTDVVGQVFLAHMLQCARCHDHKFDPIPTRDYYSMQAVFATTQLCERPAAFLPDENTDGFEERAYLDQRMEFYRKTLSELDQKRTLAAARKWYEEYGRDPAAFERAVTDLKSTDRDESDITLDEVRRRLEKQDTHPDLIPPRHAGFEPRDFGMERVARKGIERLTWRLERYQPFAFSVYNGRTPELRSVYAPLRIPKDPDKDGELEATAILAGGDPFSPTQPVQPGVLSVVAQTQEDAVSSTDLPRGPAGPDIPSEISGRRRALAQWIASPDNPLTARVMANRLWQWHFGKAIAGNPNNFGATGKKPTHPDLLDWLAATFIDRGWSVKEMHRLIVSSEAYRRSTHHPRPQVLGERDPNGESWAVFLPRRLDAEELRDAMLAVSGELNREVGGIPIRPEMNLEAALQPRMVMGTFAEAWQPSPLPRQRHRRSIYALRIRGHRDPFMEVFNAPAPDLCCEAREASTVTPQVFALFNSEITFDRALAMASRLRKESDSRSQLIGLAIQTAFGRPASEDEVNACLAHWDKMTKRHEKLTFPPPQSPPQVVREAVEENTGEKFTFTEPLEVYADFVPDLKAADATPELRGLAEVCLVLLNSNEFAYVY